MILKTGHYGSSWRTIVVTINGPSLRIYHAYDRSWHPNLVATPCFNLTVSVQELDI